MEEITGNRRKNISDDIFCQVLKDFFIVESDKDKEIVEVGAQESMNISN